ncbi:sensor histidine kinase [Hymenobacter chitinivorans]|nr:histidine kinase dimerization/phospho-acceptor domain-containing protein [Hymenobacter chitinivorans]
MLRRPLSLRTSLFLALALVVGLTTGLAGGYQYLHLRQVLSRADDARLQARATLLLNRTELGNDRPVVPLPDQLDERILVRYVAPGAPPLEIFRSAGWPGFTTEGWRRVRVQRTMILRPDDHLELWLAHPDTALHTELAQVRQGLLLTALGSLLLAVVLALALGNVVLRPLRRMAQAARAVATARDAVSLPVPATYDEVQELAEALNAMLRRLREGAQLQDNFLAAAAHELRTPLATLHTGLAVTLLDPALPAANHQQLSGQLEEIRRLSRLVDDFLLVSRLGAEALPLHLHPVLLDELVLAATDRLLPRFRTAGRPLELLFDEQVASYQVLADADKLTTVLLNLLENAMRHAPPGAAVQVVVGREPGSAGLFAAVRNPLPHSLGDLSRLTSAYYQADVLSDGAGLGLWLSSRIAELHGARLLLREEDNIFEARVQFAVSGSAA